MEKPWIIECGECGENDISELLDRFNEERASSCYIAFFTNGFNSGKDVGSLSLNPANLLEMRVFNTDRELWIHRSTVGKKFTWRIASEPNENKYYFIHDHALDINERCEFESSIDEDGSMKIMSTVGGIYTLPVDEDVNSVEIVTYLSYDDQGVAKAMDNRIRRFFKKDGV